MKVACRNEHPSDFGHSMSKHYLDTLPFLEGTPTSMYQDVLMPELLKL